MFFLCVTHVQSVAPFGVSTAIVNSPPTNLFVIDAVKYARSAVATIGIQGYTHGCLPHAIQV